MCSVLTQTEPVEVPGVLCKDVCVGTADANTESDGPSLQRDNKYLLPGTDEHLEYIDEVNRLIEELNLTEKSHSSILRRKKAIEKLVKQFKLTEEARKLIKKKLQNMLGQKRLEKAMIEKADLTGNSVAQIRKEKVAAAKPRQLKSALTEEPETNSVQLGTSVQTSTATDFNVAPPEPMDEDIPNPYAVTDKLAKDCVVAVAYDTKSYIGKVVTDMGEKCEVLFYAYKSITNGLVYEPKKKRDIERDMYCCCYCCYCFAYAETNGRQKNLYSLFFIQYFYLIL